MHCHSSKVTMKVSVAQFSVHGVLQARILEWVAIPFSRGPSQPGIEPRSPALQADALLSEPQGSPAGKFKECQTHGWNTR